MARTKTTVGIDIGTHTTRVVVIGFNKESNAKELLATGSSTTRGMRLGYINDTEQVSGSVREAVAQAEKSLGFKIRRAFVSIGGVNLSSTVSTGQVIISRADQEVTQLDISKALSDSEENLDILNRKIIHIIPISYKLDGKELHARPEGLKGIKLEVKTLFITCLKQNIEDLVTTLALAGIEIEDIIATPFASATILLSQKQKTAGCALLDIGAETVSIACFENNNPISLQVFQIGSMDITKDIALGFRIGLEEAESIKLGSIVGGDYPKKKVDEIIEARLSDIFELASNHLKRIRRNELLPAGIVITGGGAYINHIEDLARAQLKLPSRIGQIDSSISNKLKVKDASWYGAFGLALSPNNNSSSASVDGLFNDNVKQVKGFFKSMLSQLLP